MPEATEQFNQGRCSFCAVPDVPLWRLVVGPEASICADCVELVSEVLRKNAADPESVGWVRGTLH